jgi:hypothetical protein
VQVSNQYRVDAPVEWVRSFLVIGTREEDVTIDGDVVEVRQNDRFIRLVVRNTVAADGDATLLDVDATLRLLGMGRVVGTVFRGRVRRTLERSLDGLPAAIERALANSELEPDEGDATGEQRSS